MQDREIMLTEKPAFIGRKKEIAFLDEWLADDTAPAVVYIHDALKDKEKKGGIGKTLLLRKFYDLVERRPERTLIPVFIDFFNIQNRNSIAIAVQVIETIKKKYPHWSA